MPIRTKRVYDAPSPDDGVRLLVMRRWPRAISKDRVDEWNKQLGAPDDLIEDWMARGIDWEEFTRRYSEAMEGQQDVISELARRAADERITLLCGCRDRRHCHRTLLKKMIEQRAKRP